MEPIRLFVVDDHSLFRIALCELLKENRDIDVIGEAGESDEAIREIRNSIPDIVLMDIDFGPSKEFEGIRLTQTITEEFKDRVRVIMLTMHDDDEYVVKAYEAGASGYVLKRSEPKTMIQTIHDVYQGGVILSPDQAVRVLRRFHQMKKQLDQSLIHLTVKEKEVLQLVAEGASNRKIAEKMNVSVNTVRNRLSLIFSKLHVNNRTQAAQQAVKMGLSSTTNPMGDVNTN